MPNQKIRQSNDIFEQISKLLITLTLPSQFLIEPDATMSSGFFIFFYQPTNIDYYKNFALSSFLGEMFDACIVTYDIEPEFKDF